MSALSTKLVISMFGAIFLASCTSSPRYTSYPTEKATSPADKRKEVVRIALSYLGTPYRNGGASASGVDCSGLVQAVYAQIGVKLPRTSFDQSRVGERISRAELKPGDLLFFVTSRSRRVSHVGIYMGRGKFVHASTRARKVRVDELGHSYFRARFVMARRVL